MSRLSISDLWRDRGYGYISSNCSNFEEHIFLASHSRAWNAISGYSHNVEHWYTVMAILWYWIGWICVEKIAPNSRLLRTTRLSVLTMLFFRLDRMLIQFMCFKMAPFGTWTLVLQTPDDLTPLCKDICITILVKVFRRLNRGIIRLNKCKHGQPLSSFLDRISYCVEMLLEAIELFWAPCQCWKQYGSVRPRLLNSYQALRNSARFHPLLIGQILSSGFLLYVLAQAVYRIYIFWASDRVLTILLRIARSLKNATLNMAELAFVIFVLLKAIFIGMFWGLFEELKCGSNWTPANEVEPYGRIDNSAETDDHITASSAITELVETPTTPHVNIDSLLLLTVWETYEEHNLIASADHDSTNSRAIEERYQFEDRFDSPLSTADLPDGYGPFTREPQTSEQIVDPAQVYEQSDQWQASPLHPSQQQNSTDDTNSLVCAESFFGCSSAEIDSIDDSTSGPKSPVQAESAVVHSSFGNSSDSNDGLWLRLL